MTNLHNFMAVALWVFWVLLILFIATRRKWRWWIRLVLIGAIVAHLVFLVILPMQHAQAQQAQQLAERKAYFRQAWDYFHTRCETESGRFIYRRVHEPQRSIYVMKIKPGASGLDLADQYWMGDPYAVNTLDPDMIGIYGRLLDKSEWNELGTLDFVEAPSLEGEDTPYWHYDMPPTGRMKHDWRIQKDVPERKYAKTPIDRIQSRYGYTWDDLSSELDRFYWVAKSRLQIVDLQTGEVIAERIGFVIEENFGARGYGRTPWSDTGVGELKMGRRLTNYCPADPKTNDDLWMISVMLDKPFTEVLSK